jgi:hypothetical protein
MQDITKDLTTEDTEEHRGTQRKELEEQIQFEISD